MNNTFESLENHEKQIHPNLRVVARQMMHEVPVIAYTTESEVGIGTLRQYRIASPGFSHIVRSEWSK